MLTFRQTFSLPAFPAQDTDTLYFDIETTGLSARTSSLYLVGCCYFDGTDWQLIQWFAESMTDETALLRAFFEQLSHFTKLIHYNGTGFDIPYLESCVRQYRLQLGFSKITGFDLFHTARHLKRILQLENYKQKTVEQFFHLTREDRKNGGELIGQYLLYTKSGDESLLPELLLHNAEDVANLPRLHAALGAYEGLAEAEYFLSRRESEEGLHLILTLPGYHFPVAVDTSCGCANAHLEGDCLDILLPFFHGELKHFFPDYKEYYYLPEEDMAIHQKVAQFVDKSRRKRATAATCYTKSSGTFLEQPAAILSPDFTEGYRGKRHFILYQPDKLTEEELRRLISALLPELYPQSRS